MLVTHPRVMDVAVFGVPNEDFGEEVKAVIQPKDWSDATPEFAEELIEFCRTHISHIKCPRRCGCREGVAAHHPTGRLLQATAKGPLLEEAQKSA
ncbi:MAG: hypothetical protein U5O39_12170 [Gammaproteobacteria bacterium]|nr:hypothetical protein [Gammaproteobacteria bacterium]